jgi:MerR family transcriptional regulator, light-induced transcriptional regulator
MSETPLADILAPIGPKGYSIRVASRMTGLSVDTLRMWERRYDFPSPIRNGAGNRLYGEADVERLILVARAMKIGYRAGEAIRLTNKDLAQLLASHPTAPSNASDANSAEVERLLNLVRSDEIDLLRTELRRMTGVIGAKRFVVEVAGPMLDAIGYAWASGALRVHQEHLASAALATHLRLLSLLHAGANGPRLILATLPREQHSLGLEMAALMAALGGATVETLGPDAPTSEIAQAASALRVQAVGLSVSLATAPPAVSAHVAWLAEHLPTPIGLWLGGKGATLLEELPSRVKVLRDWTDLDDAIVGLARGL